MTTGTGENAAVAGAGDIARDWRELRADGDIQFAPVKVPEAVPPATPDWLERFVDWLGRVMKPFGELLADIFGGIGRALGVSGQVIMWGAVALGVLLVAYLLIRLLVPLARRRREAAAEEVAWTPDSGEALALLEDADRLAAEGRYDEATHLLLKRSVGQIAAARPDLLEPSSTAREIAELSALPEAARGAFATIAGRVERSLFALRRLSADDWQAARDAYAEFALAGPRLAQVPA